jgi:hypothetical protein
MPICWLVDAASWPHTIKPDGISYLDIALECAKGNWKAIVNAYWSPGYSAILTLWLRIVNPSPFKEVVSVHFLNCLLLGVAMICLGYFLSSLCRYVERRADAGGMQHLPFWAIKTIGFILFFWTSIYLTPPSIDTPDALVTAIVLLAGGLLLQIANGNGVLKFVLLGAVLGTGFLIKAALFPLAFIFLACSVFAVGNLRRAIPKLIICVFIFLLVSGPFILALSKSKGRFTFNDTGGIAYAEYVNGISLFVNWQGGPEGAGSPKHPERKVFDNPTVYEYATPIGGCYPPWTDPSYWYDGVRPHFQFGNQLNAMRLGFDQYFDVITQLGALLAGFLVLLFCGQRLGDYFKSFLSLIFLWGPALAAFSLYGLIHVETRFLPGFILLLYAALFSAIRIPKSETTEVLFRCVTGAIVILLGFQIFWSASHSLVRLITTHPFPERDVVQELQRNGVNEGDKVAFIGAPLADRYWAHLGRLTIVAEVPGDEVANFLESSPEVKSRVVETFGSFGTKAVLAEGLPAKELANGWKRIAGTNYYVLYIRKS